MDRQNRVHAVISAPKVIGATGVNPKQTAFFCRIREPHIRLHGKIAASAAVVRPSVKVALNHVLLI
jgi:hypothetical protein